MKKTLLKLIGVALAIGCASAGAVDPDYQLGTHTATGHQPTVVASAVGYAPQGTPAGLTQAGNLRLSSGVHSAATSSNGSQINLSAVAAPGGSSLRSSGTGDRQQGKGYLVSVAAVPEPSGGAMLLCGLVVLAFIARRKTQ